MPLTREQLEAPMRDIAKQLDGLLREIHGERTGFALFVFDFGDSGSLAYIANAQRQEMITAIKECLARLESGITSDPIGPKVEA